LLMGYLRRAGISLRIQGPHRRLQRAVRAHLGAVPAVVALVAVLLSLCDAATPQTSRDFRHLLTPADITSVSGGEKVVAVSGHTATNWQPWLIGTTAVVPVLGAAIGARAACRRTAGVRP
jgi:hypothetical protein